MVPSPEEQVLSNSPALHSLKRPQLLALCRQFGLRGAGKNTELVARLEAHGALLAQSGDPSVLQPHDPADVSAASWAVVASDAVPVNDEVLAEFGVRGPSSSDSLAAPGSATLGSASSTSVGSTIRSVGATLLRALVDPGRKNETAKGEAAAHEPCPHLSCGPRTWNSQEQAEEEFADELGLDGVQAGGIRLPSRSTMPDPTVDTPTDSQPLGRPLPHTEPSFVFGSPPPPTAPSSTFTFTMPGALFASTSSTTSTASNASVAEPTACAMDAIMAEMNRRAAESRATASRPRGSSSLLYHAGAAGGPKLSPSKGSKAAFDESHKRRFDKMDSITTHWAAKRALPSSSSSLSALAGMSRSVSARSLIANADTPVQANEPAAKRIKRAPSKPFGPGRVAGGPGSNKTAGEKRLVSALRDEGWSAAPVASSSFSLSSSMHPPARPREVREDVKPREAIERERRKRQLELAKARRKSGAANGAGLSRRRPSLGVGPNPTGSTASRLFKSTMRKLTPTSSFSPSNAKTAFPPLAGSTSSRTLAPANSTRPLPTSVAGSIPRFAASTASSSSRSAIASTSTSVAVSPPKKAQPGWKKFDLQASLQRPLSWKTPHLATPAPCEGASPSAPRPSSTAFYPAGSASKRRTAAQGGFPKRVANKGLPSPVRPAQKIPAESSAPAAAVAVVDEPVAPLPTLSGTTLLRNAPGPAPLPLQPLTNIAPDAAASPVFGVWQPPAVTKRPVLPSSSSVSIASGIASSAVTATATATALPAAAPAPRKKLVSSATRAARGGEKACAKAHVERLESRARKVRAAAAAASAKTREASATR
ncbi:hypothetical protein JCM3770_004700 [Rhodotorula araucariae]